MAFAKSGSILYSSGADGMVCELDVDSGHLLGKFKASKRVVSCIAVSGGDNCINSCLKDIQCPYWAFTYIMHKT